MSGSSGLYLSVYDPFSNADNCSSNFKIFLLPLNRGQFSDKQSIRQNINDTLLWCGYELKIESNIWKLTNALCQIKTQLSRKANHTINDDNGHNDPQRNFLLVLQILLPLYLLFTDSFSPPPASNCNSFAKCVANRPYFKQ